MKRPMLSWPTAQGRASITTTATARAIQLVLAHGPAAQSSRPAIPADLDDCTAVSCIIAAAPPPARTTPSGE